MEKSTTRRTDDQHNVLKLAKHPPQEVLRQRHDPHRLPLGIARTEHLEATKAAEALDRAEPLLSGADCYLEFARHLGSQGASQGTLPACLESLPEVPTQLRRDLRVAFESSHMETEMQNRNHWLISVSRGADASLSGPFTSKQAEDAGNVVVRHNPTVLELALEDGELTMTKLQPQQEAPRPNPDLEVDPEEDTVLAPPAEQSSVFSRLEKFTTAAKEANVVATGTPKDSDIFANLADLWQDQGGEG